MRSQNLCIHNSHMSDRISFISFWKLEEEKIIFSLLLNSICTMFNTLYNSNSSFEQQKLFSIYNWDELFKFSTEMYRTLPIYENALYFMIWTNFKSKDERRSTDQADKEIWKFSRHFLLFFLYQLFYEKRLIEEKWKYMRYDEVKVMFSI